MAFCLKYLIYEFLNYNQEPNNVKKHIVEKILRQIVTISNKKCADLVDASYNIFHNQHDEFVQFLFNIASCRTGAQIIKRCCKKIFLNLLKYNCDLIVTRSGINPTHILSFLKRTKCKNKIVLTCLDEMISQTEKICDMLDNIM